MKQLQAAIDMLAATMTRFGQLIVANRGYLLQTIVWIGYIVTSASAATARAGTTLAAAGLKSVRNAVMRSCRSWR
mgnify:CR=1 FL=1